MSVSERLGAERIATGVPGLDRVLFGGLSPGAVYIVQGQPGAGKTVLANQICFHRAAQGEPVVYITLLAESHDRLLSNLQAMAFYDAESVLSRIAYVSGFDLLLREGLDSMLKLVRAESRTRGAKLLVLDGLFVAEETARSDPDFRKFINDLEALANLLGCTVLLLTNGRGKTDSPEYTMVDGWIQLDNRVDGYRPVRELTVHKYRGSNFLGGNHPLTITDQGITVLPRLESLTGPGCGDQSDRPVPTGARGLDVILDGGLPCASTTLLVGSSGVGKTTMGLSFVAASTPQEPGLIFSFYEMPERLRLKASKLGLELPEDAVEIIWNSPSDAVSELLAHRLLEAVDRRGVKRLLVDGLAGFRRGMIYPERMSVFFAALSVELRRRDVTVLYTAETPQLIGGEAAVNISDQSAVAENILLMRYTSVQGCLRRALSMLKVRDRDYDSRVHEFRIGQGGIVVDGTFPHDVSFERDEDRPLEDDGL